MFTSTSVLIVCIPIALFLVALGCLAIAASMRFSQISQAEEKYKGMEN